MTVVVDGDKVTINGKPVEEWGGKDIKVFRNGEPFMGHMNPNIQRKISVFTNLLPCGFCLTVYFFLRQQF